MAHTQLNSKSISDLAAMLIHDTRNGVTATEFCSFIKSDGNARDFEIGVAEGILKRAGKVRRITNTLEGSNFPETEDPNMLAIYQNKLVSKARRIKAIASGIERGSDLITDKNYLEFAKYIKTGALKTIGAADLMEWGNMSPERIRESYLLTDILSIVKDKAYHHSVELERRGLNVGINIYHNDVQKILTSESFFKAVLWNLFLNTGEYVINETPIDVGVREQRGGIEILVSEYNSGKPARETFGEGKGRGKRFTRKVVLDAMQGEYNILDEAINPANYESLVQIGDKSAISRPSEAKIYTARILIPNGQPAETKIDYSKLKN